MDLKKIKVGESVVAASKEKIGQEWAGYKNCLVAISGDCSKQGMGNFNEVRPFQEKHKSIVKEFLRAQSEWDLQSTLEDDLQGPEVKKAWAAYREWFDKLRKAGIFEHKYHARTEWKLAYLDEDELAKYKPWQIGQ